MIVEREKGRDDQAFGRVRLKPPHDDEFVDRLISTSSSRSRSPPLSTSFFKKKSQNPFPFGFAPAPAAAPQPNKPKLGTFAIISYSASKSLSSSDIEFLDDAFSSEREWWGGGREELRGGAMFGGGVDDDDDDDERSIERPLGCGVLVSLSAASVTDLIAEEAAAPIGSNICRKEDICEFLRERERLLFCVFTMFVSCWVSPSKDEVITRQLHSKALLMSSMHSHM